METLAAVLEVLEVPQIVAHPAVNSTPAPLDWRTLDRATLESIRADREIGGMKWKDLEKKYNLVGHNGMDSYNAVQKLRNLEAGLPVAHRTDPKPAKAPKAPRQPKAEVVQLGAGI